jgi:hypothetical protein
MGDEILCLVCLRHLLGRPLRMTDFTAQVPRSLDRWPAKLQMKAVLHQMAPGTFHYRPVRRCTSACGSYFAADAPPGLPQNALRAGFHSPVRPFTFLAGAREREGHMRYQLYRVQYVADDGETMRRAAI